MSIKNDVHDTPPQIFSKKYLKKMYNFFTMFFFGKNLKAKHKVALCLAALGILANCWVCTKLPGTFPYYVEFLENGYKRFYWTEIILAYGTFIKMLMICIFRKF